MALSGFVRFVRIYMLISDLMLGLLVRGGG